MCKTNWNRNIVFRSCGYVFLLSQTSLCIFCYKQTCNTFHRFNDKRDSLADAHLNKIQGLKNSFNDQRVTGVDSYDRAKKDMGSDEWEQEVKGVEMIVSIARQKPEVTTHITRLKVI